MLQRPQDPDLLDVNGSSPLIQASLEGPGHLAIMRKLLEAVPIRICPTMTATLH